MLSAICKLATLTLLASIVSAQTTEHDTGYTSLPAIHSVREVFTPEELSAIRSSEAVTLTPLKFEEKIANAWLRGRSDATKDLSKNVTSDVGGVQLERILRKNEENTLQMTPEQIKANLIRAYQLGGLHAINQVRKTARKSLSPIRGATSNELGEMKREHRAMIYAIRKLGGDGTLARISRRHPLTEAEMKHEHIDMIRSIRELGGNGELERMAKKHHSSEYEDSEEEELNDINEFDVSSVKIGDFDVAQGGAFNERRCPRRPNRRICRRREFRRCRRCRRFIESDSYGEGGEDEESVDVSYENEEMNSNAVKSSNNEIEAKAAEERLDSLFETNQFGWGFGWGFRPWGFGGWGFRPWGFGWGFRPWGFRRWGWW